jgi:hypothetical protein
MAHWKRLTGTDGDQIDVNMDAVAYLQDFKDHTAIHFVGGLSERAHICAWPTSELRALAARSTR